MHRWSRIPVASLLLLAVVLMGVQAWGLGFCFQDDAYISMRYARNLAEGSGLVYNPGERVEGYTNFLWTVLLSLPFALTLPAEGTIWWAGLGSGVLLLAGTGALAWSVSRNPLAAGIAAVLVAAIPAVVAESVMGLETALFAGLVTLALARWIREEQAALARPWGGVLFGLALLTRPEGYLVAGLALLADLASKGWARTAFWWRWGACALLGGAHLAFRLAYYGDLVPNTFHAKVGGGAAAVDRGLGNVADFAWATLPLLALAAVGCRALARRRGTGTRGGNQAARAWQIPVLAIAYVGYVAAVGGDFKPTLRFFAVPIALGAAVAGAAVAGWIDRPRRPLAVGAAGAAVALCAGWTLAAGEPAREFCRWRAQQIPVHRAAGHYLGERMGPDGWLATGNAGLVPYSSRQPTIDIVGLCDRQIARRDVEGMGERMAGHGKGDGDYVLSRQPEVILFQNARFTDRPLRKADVGRVLFSLSEREMWQDPRLHENYRLVSERMPGFYFNFFERTP